MAIMTDPIKIPFEYVNDTQSIKKSAKELEDTLTKAVNNNKMPRNASLDRLHNQIKNSVLRSRELRKSLEDINKVKYESKFGDAIQKQMNRVTEATEKQQAAQNKKIDFVQQYKANPQQTKEYAALDTKMSDLNAKKQKYQVFIDDLVQANQDMKAQMEQVSAEYSQMLDEKYAEEEANIQNSINAVKEEVAEKESAYTQLQQVYAAQENELQALFKQRDLQGKSLAEHQEKHSIGAESDDQLMLAKSAYDDINAAIDNQITKMGATEKSIAAQKEEIDECAGAAEEYVKELEKLNDIKLAEQSEGLKEIEENFKSQEDQIKVYRRHLLDTIKEMQAVDNQMKEMEQSGGQFMSADQLAEYQKLEAEEQKYAQIVEESMEKIRELREKDNQSAAEWADKQTQEKARIEGALSTNNDRMRVEYTQIGQQVYTNVKQIGGLIVKVVSTLTGGVGKGASKAIGVLTNNLQMVLGVLKNVKGLLPNISSGASAIFKQLKNGVLGIAALILGVRSLSSILGKLKSMLMTGFKDIYNQDKQFKTQIDTIKQKFLDIQVALAEAFMPIVQIALPYIKQLLDWVMSLLGVLTRFISTVTGIQAYSKAIKGLGGAAASASKQLSKFDELNNLSSGGGGGLTPNAGSIGDPKEVESWFDFVRNIIDNLQEMLENIPWEKVYDKARQFARTLADIINAIAKPEFWGVVGSTLAKILDTIIYFFNELGDKLHFDDIGKSIFEFLWHLFDDFDMAAFTQTVGIWANGIWTTIREVLTGENEGMTLAERFTSKITEGLQGIDWNKVWETVKEIGKTLGQFLNDLLDPEMMGEIGRTVGGALQSIFVFAVSFLTKGGFDFVNLGKSIAEFINGVFEQVDGGTLAKAINSLVNGLLGTLKVVISKVDWKEIFNDIGKFLGTVDWKVIFATIVPPILAFFGTLGQSIATALFTVLKFWIGKKLMDGTLFTTIGSALSNIGTAIQSAFAFLGSGKFAAYLIGIKNIALKVFGAISNAVSTLMALVLEFFGVWQLISGVGESLSLLFDFDFMGASSDQWAESSPIAMLLKMITGDFDSNAWDEVWTEFFDNIVEFWTVDVPQFFNEHPWTAILFSTSTLDTEGMKEKFKETISNVIDSLNDFGDEYGTKIDTWIKDTLGPIFSDETWKNLTQPIFDAITTVWTNVTTWWQENIVAWWDSDVAPWFTLDKWVEIITSIGSAVEQVWNETVDFWETALTDWWTNYVEPWFTLDKWTEMLSPIETAFGNVFKAAANMAIGALNNVIGALESFLNNGVFSAINGLLETANKLPGATNIPTLSNITLNRIPALASGTVIPPTMNEFIARLGDNKQETEVVSPLSTMKQAMVEAMQEMGGFGGGDINIELTVDGKTLARTVVRQNEVYKKQTGRSLFAT